MNIFKTIVFLSICATVPFGATAMKRKHEEVETGDSQQMRDTRLLIAVTNGNIEEIKKELTNGANPSGVVTFGHTPLQRAITQISAYDHDNITEQEEFTILDAREKKALEIVQLLCQHNADPNFFTYSTRHSPLQLATQYQQPPIIKTLLQHGADINAGKPWLNVSDEEIAKIYIQHGIGATIDQTSSENHNILNKIIANRMRTMQEKEAVIKVIYGEALKHNKLDTLLNHKNNDDKMPHELVSNESLKQLLNPAKAERFAIPSIIREKYLLREKYEKKQLPSANMYHALMRRELTGKNPWN